MAEVANRPLVIREASGYTNLLMFTNPDGSAKDVSGMVFKAEIRRQPNEDLLGVFTFDMTNAATGQVLMKLAAAVTTGKANLQWWYDLYWTVGAGEPFPVMGGQIKIQPRITQ